jgi:DinB superfamily
MPSCIDICQCGVLAVAEGGGSDAGAAYRDQEDPAGYPGGAPNAGPWLDDSRLRRRPTPGEWAIIEVVAHLADTEERALGRVRRMLTEDDPQLEPFDQEALAVQHHYLELGAR